VDFLTQLDEDLKDYKDKGKAATHCSDQKAVDFLAQLDEDLKDYKDKSRAATPCSDQEVVDFLKSWTRTSSTTRTRTGRRSEPPMATGARPPPVAAPPRPGLSPNRRASA